MDEARKLAAQMRRTLGLPEIPDSLPKSLAGVWGAAARVARDAVFVRREKRKRREAMGNGVSELWIGDDSRLDDDVEAALVLDSHRSE